MKKTVLVLIFTLCTVFSALAFSVRADGALRLSVAASGGDYTSVESALAAVENMAKKGELNEHGVQLVLTGTHTATEKAGVLFGQKTIFLPDGTKLPITLTGGTLILPAADVACANDYTFTGMTLPFDDTATRLFAGSGNVTLKNLTLDRNGKEEYKSCFYGDTFTAAVFEGWTEKNLALYEEKGLFVSAMTLGEGFTYQNTSGYPYAAVGSSTDFSAKIGGRTLSADDTRPKLIIDGATLFNTMARAGSNPVADSVLCIKSGTVNHLYAAGHGLFAEHTGDVTVLVEGGTFQSSVLLISDLNLRGNLNVVLKNMDLTPNTDVADGCMIQTVFGATTVHGNVSVTMENVKADRYYGGTGSSAITVTGDVSASAKNCEFSTFFYGGAGKATVCGNIENTLENTALANFKGADDCVLLGKASSYTGSADTVGNLFNRLKNVTFHSKTAVTVILGNLSGTQTGKVFNTLEKVTVPTDTVFYCGNRGGTSGGIVNTVLDSAFSDAFYGGGTGGTVLDVQNFLTNVTFYDYAYLAGGSNTVKGQIENHLTNCNVTKYYAFGGVNGGKIYNTHLEFGVRNFISGGSFHGFWGGSASQAAKHQGNIYTEISSGEFFGFDTSKPNSFAGGCRNTKHEGNAVSLIHGGTFHGKVAGGSIPNSESYKQTHVGSATLTLTGGTFRDSVLANCLWGSYSEAALHLDVSDAASPLSLAVPMEFDSVLAGGEQTYTLSADLRCKTLITRGTGSLQICGDVVCDTFLAEEGSAPPEIYGSVRCGNLNLNGAMLILGAKGFVSAESVTGEVVLHQTEFWLNQTYFTSPASTPIILSHTESVLGEPRLENGVVTGVSNAFAGVGIVFSDTVSLRFAFNKEWAEANKNTFIFSAKCGDRTIVNQVKFSNLVLRDGYYTTVSAPLSAAELGNRITYGGSLVPEDSFSLTDLAENGVKIYDKEGKHKALGELLKAFANYTVATDNYKNGKSRPLPYPENASETGFTATDGFAPLIASPLVSLTHKQLVLDDGIRIRYYFRSAEMSSSAKNSSPVNKLYYFRNCEDVTENTVREWVETSSDKGYIKITVDLPAYPSQSHQVIRLMVTDKADLHKALPAVDPPYKTYVHEDYVDRPDSIAETLSKTSGSEELGSALLYYLQAGANYYATQPDLSDFTYPETFSAGYAREDISPHGFVLDLSSSKTSKAVVDPLYASCLALWDGEELALYFSLDVRQSPDYLTKNAKELLSREFDIDPDKIFFNATHNHSSPNTTSHTRSDIKKWYGEIFFPKMLMAAKKAVLDLAPATLYTGKANSDPGTNYVRRYLRKDGSYTGIHNIVPTTNIVAYESEADKELRTLRFDRGDQKDILFVNWQGHAAHGAVYDYAATADFVGFLRDGVEDNLDVHFIYCNGASGNLNFTPKLGEKYFSSPYFREIGKSLVGTVLTAVGGEKSIRSGKIEVSYISHTGVIRHDDPAVVAKANECYTAWQAYKKEKGSDPSISWFQTNYGFQSRYDVSFIRTRAGLGETELLPAWAFSFGDVGMAFVPYEMFDSNGQQIRGTSPFRVTMIGGYTNDTKGYIPSSFAAPHNGYEVYTSRYVFSTGDEMASKLAQALTKMHENTK